LFLGFRISISLTSSFGSILSLTWKWKPSRHLVVAHCQKCIMYRQQDRGPSNRIVV
jgi:hypothetical protein